MNQPVTREVESIDITYAGEYVAHVFTTEDDGVTWFTYELPITRIEYSDLCATGRVAYCEGDYRKFEPSSVVIS